MNEATDLKGNSQTDILKENEPAEKEKYDMEIILDIPLDISVELGQAKMPVAELLHLGQGSIVELTKLIGEPLDIYVNNKLFARGEVVILNEKYGIRVVDIINPVDRAKSLS